MSDDAATDEPSQTGAPDWAEFVGQALDPDACFLCGCAVDDDRLRRHPPRLRRPPSAAPPHPRQGHLECPPKFVIGKTDDQFNVMVHQAASVGRLPYADWDPELYAKVLSALVRTRIGVELDVLHRTPGFLISSRGDPIQAPNAEWVPEVWDDPAVLQEAGENATD